jgi:hypothetical protein
MNEKKKIGFERLEDVRVKMQDSRNRPLFIFPSRHVRYFFANNG